ncbi:hypothetical protein [Psychrobacillus antarcticus]|nr:hypothetical protein [Psychrobacillus antarcticus]
MDKFTVPQVNPYRPQVNSDGELVTNRIELVKYDVAQVTIR